VAFETAQATQNSTYKAVLRVPHGCAGKPTVNVRVRIPAGVIDVKPMPKAGWTLETIKAPDAKPPAVVQGNPIAEGITEIAWSGSLADGHFDEFVFLARITDAVAAGSDLAFPVVQTCAGGSEEWIEIAAPGQDAQGLKKPAPTVKVVEAASAPKSFGSGAIAIEQPWSRATPAGATVGGGYLRVTNTGREPDRLIGGTFPLAARVELHEMSMADNVMRMKQVTGGLEIKPGESVELRPGGYHLMFVDLREGLKDGQMVKGTLVFEKAGPIEVEYQIRGMAGAAAPAAHQHH
jgi:copper(I)-binding protein